MATHRNSWKNRERKIAAFFGTKRTPLSGGNSGHTRSDTLHPKLFVEVKMRQHHPVLDLWFEAKKLAMAGDWPVPPIAMLVERETNDSWVLWHSASTMKMPDPMSTWVYTVIRKSFAVTNLWKVTAVLAEREDKIPLVALVEKGKAGFWLLCSLPQYIETIRFIKEM